MPQSATQGRPIYRPQESVQNGVISLQALRFRAMENPSVTDTEFDAPFSVQAVEAQSPAVVDDELLVEEISIDGMCGVY